MLVVYATGASMRASRCFYASSTIERVKEVKVVKEALLRMNLRKIAEKYFHETVTRD